MASLDPSVWTAALQSYIDGFTENPPPTAVIVAGGVVVLSAAFLIVRSSWKAARGKKRLDEIAAGGIARNEINKVFDDFTNCYGAGAGIKEKTKTLGVVDTFYNLVTDFYEWGWGESFHFTVPLHGKTHFASEAANESRIATLCDLKPGMKCLDCGCGVGGPMRTIASFSGAEIVGVSLNQYQVDRGNSHNRRDGLESLCKIVQGDFLDLKFPDNSFDAAYATDSTCHAPDISVVYGEIFRVIKPGSTFVSYEWVTTPLFDPKNPEHVKIIDKINYGNGLPNSRPAAECIEAAKRVGFEVVTDYDNALRLKQNQPWYARLEKVYNRGSKIDRIFIKLFSMLRLLPAGMKQVHDMLLDDAILGLIAGGKTGIFTPMHILVFRKPLETKA